MQAHEQRVVDERKELGEKLNKLKSFIMSPILKTLPPDEQSRLDRQYDAMLAYYNILGERISHFIGFEPKSGAIGVSSAENGATCAESDGD